MALAGIWFIYYDLLSSIIALKKRASTISPLQSVSYQTITKKEGNPNQLKWLTSFSHDTPRENLPIIKLQLSPEHLIKWGPNDRMWKSKMGKTASRVLVQRVMAFLFIASSVNGGAMAISICSIESSKMNLCLPAVSGKSPTQPTEQCCAVVSGAKLSCLCSYKNLLPAFGINPKYALALPKKCGLETPPECRGRLRFI